MQRAGAVALIVVGITTTVLFANAFVESAENTIIATAVLLVGPAWGLSFCWASGESDFAGGSRTRAEWLRVLPWTFILAPLVVPNVVLLGSFFRDSRADGGRSPLTWDRMRPGDEGHEHWPS